MRVWRIVRSLHVVTIAIIGLSSVVLATDTPSASAVTDA
jgi:hypothetical protein